MKETKKVISVFLAILMTMSCLTAALPTISFAAASTSQWNALKTAVQNAGTNLKTSNYTKSGATSASSRTITDKTTNSSVYNVILKLYDCINAEMGKSNSANYSYPSALISRMKSEMSSKLTSSVYTGNAKTALDDLVTYIISFDSFTKNKDNKARAETIVGYPTPYGGLSEIDNVTITVKRTRDAAIMSCSALSSVPASVETSFKIAVNNGLAGQGKNDSSISEGGFWNHKYAKYGWYYFTGMSKTANVSKEDTNIAVLRTYLNYFTSSLVKQDPYTKYSFATLDALNELVAKNTDNQTKLSDAVTAKKLSNTVVEYFAKKVHGTNGTKVVDDWCTECSSAAVYFSYKDKIDWLAENIVPLSEEKLNALDYTYMDVEEVRSLLATADSYYKYLENTVKSNYRTAYDRYVKEGYDASLVNTKISAMKYYVDCHDLALLKEEMDSFIQQYPDVKVLDDTTLAEVYDKMSGYISAVKSYDSEVIAKIFTEGTGYAETYKNDCLVEITYREAQTVFSSYTTYFDPLINNANNGKLYVYSTSEIRDMISEGTDKYNAFIKTYNDYRKVLPADYMSQFDSYGKDIKAYLDKLPRELVRVLTDEVNTAISLAGGWSAVSSGKVTITLANFASVKAAVNAVEDDVYTYLSTNYPSLLTSTLKTRYAKLKDLLVLAQQFEDNFLNNFKKVSYDNSKGVYTVRSIYAGDLARVEGEEYSVTGSSLNTLIGKIDDFVGSSEFTDLLGQIMENGNSKDSMFTDENGNVMNLNQFIDKMLVDNLYNDKTVTSVMQMFYPMVYKEVTKLLNDLLKQYNPLDLNSLTGGQAGGTLYLAYNGSKNSSTFEQLFSQLGLSITPSALASVSGMSSYPAVRSALNASKNNWDRVVWDNMVWNVKDYNSFVSALAVCLDGIRPLLQIILCDSTQTKNLNNAAHIDGNVSYSILNVSLEGLVSAELTIGGYTGFKDIVIPVYEALGLSSYNFTVPSSSASTRQILDCVFKPLLSLVDKVTSDPLNTVLEILPNVSYGLITDKLTDLMDFPLNIHYGLSLVLDDPGGISGLWTKVKQLIVNAVQGNLKGDVALNVKKDILGGSLENLIVIDGVQFKYTDLNWLVNFVVSKAAGLNLDLPLINAGNIITASSLNKNASSKRSSGKRVNFTTDKPDLFWVIWNYICNAAGNEQFVQQLYNAIAPAEDGSVAEVPEILGDICSNLGSRPEDCLAAVNELFVPKKYNMTPYEWYNNSEAVTDGIAAGDFAYAYLYYTNDWTDGKAVGMVENIDDVVEKLLRDSKLIGEDESFGDWLNVKVGDLFNNDLLTALIKIFATQLAPLGKGAVGAIINKQFGADLSIWETQFGNIFGVDTSAAENKKYASSKLGKLTATVTEPTDDNKNGIVWSFNGKTVADGDRNMFLDVITYAVKELAPISNLILCGSDLSLFGNALTIKGYSSYDAAIIPLAETLGITDILSQSEYIAKYKNNSVDGLNYVINVIFGEFDKLTNADMIYNVMDIVPDVLYFLQSGGLSSFLVNFLKPILVLVDTARPIYDFDINGLLQGIIDTQAEQLNPNYDPNDETRYMLDVRNIDLNAVYELIEAFTDLELKEVLQYAVEGLFYSTSAEDVPSKSAFLKNVRKVPALSASTRYEGLSEEEIKLYSRADSLTVLLSLALDLIKYGDNAAKLDKMIGGESNIAETIVSLLNYKSDSELTPIDWYYFADGVADDETFADFINNSYISGGSVSYLKYAYADGNSWTEASSSYMSANLTKIIDMIIASATDSANLNEILHKEFDKANLYTEYNVNAFGKMIGDALKNVPEVYANLAGIVLDINLKKYSKYELNESDKEKVLTKEEFAKELADVLDPVRGLLDWLLLNGDYKFFYGKNGKDSIVLSGSSGYKEGLVPVLEALGVENIPAPNAVKNSTELAEKVIVAVLDKIDTVVNAKEGQSSLQAMLDLLPNIIYFLNAGGLTASVNNLLKGVNDLLKAVEPLTGTKIDVNTLVNELLADSKIKIDINNLGFGAVADIVKSAIGLDIQNAVSVTLKDDEGKEFNYNYLNDLYIGKINKVPSLSSLGCYRMENTDETQRDILTVILCGALDVFKYPENKTVLTGWMGEDVYNGVMNILTLNADSSYKAVNWMFTDENGNIQSEYQDKVFSPLISSTDNFNYGYDEYWTREKASYVADHLNDFVNNLMKLLGIKINGVSIDNIGVIVNQLVGDSLYTNENAAKIAKLLADNIDKLLNADTTGENILAESIKQLLDVDLTVYAKYKSGTYDFGIADGDREAFTNALVEILMPLEPVLKVLLTNENITLFVDKNGRDSITVYGGEGYKYGIIPVLEALDRNNPSIKSASQYYADVQNDSEALIRDIVSPVFDFMDYVLKDPLNNLLSVLPGIIYFINSKGLDTCFKNLIRPITNILEAIEPITGEINIYDALGFNLETLDFEFIFEILIGKIAENTGKELAPLAGNAVSELTLGKLASFTSKAAENDENYPVSYTMEYVAGEQSLAGKADMLTLILRLAMKWLTLPENQETVKQLIKANIPDANDCEYVLATYETFVSYLDKPHGINMMLGLVYYIFYSLDIAVDETVDWFDDTNGKWKFIMNLINNADSDYIKNFANILNGIFKKTDDVVDSDGVASSGLVPFFQKIINWFKMIIEKIKALFNRG